MNESFEIIFHREYKRLCYAALHIIHDLPNAEDIVADVFVNVWDNWDKLDHSSSLDKYLMHAVRLRCFTHLRKRSKKEQEEIEYLSRVDYSMWQSDNVDYSILLEELLSDLPPTCQSVMREALGGVNNRQIAINLGITYQHVTSQKSKGIHILKEKIKKRIILLFLSF